MNNNNNYNNNINNNNFNISLIKVSWIKFNSKGLVENSSIKLNNKAAIYIYQFINDKSKIYVGSTCNLLERIKQHRYSVNNGNKNCPKFYNFVRKHGWDNFRLGILEYINISEFKGKHDLKKVVLDREQYYLDMLNPNLNISKTAGSTLGYKHSEEMRKTMGLQRRGKSINWLKQDLSYIISEETINNFSLSCRHGVIVKVLDKDNNVINRFPTIVSTANFYGLDHNTVSKYIKNGSSFKNLRFIAEFKDVRVWVFNKERRIVGVFSNAQKAAKFCNTNHIALRRYLKSEKLWKDKYYFSCEARLIS